MSVSQRKYRWDDPAAIPGIRASLMSLTSPNGHLGFMFSKNEEIVPYKLDDFRHALIDAFSRKLSLCELQEALVAQNPEWNQKKIFSELDYLLGLGILEPDRRQYGDPGLDRWDRQLNFLGTWSEHGRREARGFQQRLEESKVTVVGIGGFGCHVLTGLAHLGVGRITAVDFDRVQASNLNRQILFTGSDIGSLKTEIAEKRCRAINPEVDFRAVCTRITSLEDLRSVVGDTDLVVFTADSPRQKIFSWMNKCAFEKKIPSLFTLGMSPGAVRLGPLVVPGVTPCYECSLPLFPLDMDKEPAAKLNSGYHHGSIEPYLMTGAGILVNETTNFLTKLHPCRLAGAILTLDMKDYTQSICETVSRATCNFCG